MLKIFYCRIYAYHTIYVLIRLMFPVYTQRFVGSFFFITLHICSACSALSCTHVVTGVDRLILSLRSWGSWPSNVQTIKGSNNM